MGVTFDRIAVTMGGLDRGCVAVGDEGPVTVVDGAGLSAGELGASFGASGVDQFLGFTEEVGHGGCPGLVPYDADVGNVA